MPKNPISYVFKFEDKWLAENLAKQPQGTLLTEEEFKALSPGGRKEYLEYEKWVRLPKGAAR